MTHFKSWHSYRDFRDEIIWKRRHVRSTDAEEFLRTIAVTCKTRLRPVNSGKIFWRAQVAHRIKYLKLDDDDIEVEVPACPERMKPREEPALEGRVNPKGIPCVYLSTTAQAAMSEVRPWVGVLVTVAQFALVRALTIVDCSVLHDQHFHPLLDQSPSKLWSDDEVDTVVWASIDQAFSQPVAKTDDTAEYASTQTIAELFKSEGYDGVAYKSAFGADAFSVALFDIDAAKQVDCTLYRTDAVEPKFVQTGNSH